MYIPNSVRVSPIVKDTYLLSRNVSYIPCKATLAVLLEQCRLAIEKDDVYYDRHIVGIMEATPTPRYTTTNHYGVPAGLEVTPYTGVTYGVCAPNEKAYSITGHKGIGFYGLRCTELSLVPVTPNKKLLAPVVNVHVDSVPGILKVGFTDSIYHAGFIEPIIVIDPEATVNDDFKEVLLAYLRGLDFSKFWSSQVSHPIDYLYETLCTALDTYVDVIDNRSTFGSCVYDELQMRIDNGAFGATTYPTGNPSYYVPTNDQPTGGSKTTPLFFS